MSEGGRKRSSERARERASEGWREGGSEGAREGGREGANERVSESLSSRLVTRETYGDKSVKWFVKKSDNNTLFLSHNFRDCYFICIQNLVTACNRICLRAAVLHLIPVITDILRWYGKASVSSSSVVKLAVIPTGTRRVETTKLVSSHICVHGVVSTDPVRGTGNPS